MEIIKQYRIPEKEMNTGFYGSSHTFRLHWDIDTICDFHCAYCYARKQLEWNKIMNRDSIDKVLSQLKQITTPVEVALLGGEPSLSPHYFYILDELEKMPNTVATACISNAHGRVNEEWIKQHSKYKNFFFNFTFHPTEADLDTFKKHVMLASGGNVLVHVILIGPKFDKETKDIINFCIDNKIKMRANVPFNPTTLQHYMIKSKSYKEWIRGCTQYFEPYLYFDYADGTRALNDIDVYLEDLNKFKGWKCLNNNYFVDNQLKLSRFCAGPNDGQEYMTCVLERCTCQGLLSNEKINTNLLSK